MKKILLAVSFLALLAGDVFGQRKAYYFSQFYQNPQILNPAFSGVDSVWTVDVGYRKTITDFDGSPESFFVGGNGTFPLSRYREGIGENRHAQYEAEESPQSRHGVGAFVYKRSVSDYRHVVGGASYSYYVPLARSWTVSGGASFYIDNWNLDLDNLRPRRRDDPTYQDLLNDGGESTSYDLQVGVAVFRKNFYFGYTFSQRLGSPTVSDEADALVGYTGHGFNAGYRWIFSADWSLLGSAHYKILAHSKNAYLLAARADYKNVLDFGVAYKDRDAVTALFGLTVSKKIRFSYSYDLPTPEMSSDGKGSHEVVIGYQFLSGDKGRYFW
ncbi:hypothetical protein FUAX_45830 (plasmid) [Fulvitalea axinellae]|uniref:Type IX secretion system membrane protein PorP/SprF n=1 Tax=Fulvitalea axinellae TaxID=1182444 RepID=A0AAU9CSS3_9BACT|nr:hypothetical protein FUAX_45830 [Fulvitalea axinellae]